MTKPKILFFSEAYPPSAGGIAVSTQRLSGSLRRLGCEVVVATQDYSRPLTEADYLVESEDNGGRVLRFGPFPWKKTYDGHVIDEKQRASFRRRIFDRMEAMAQAYRPDIVLSFYIVNAGIYAAYAARSLGVPHVVGLRGDDVGLHIFSVDRFGVMANLIEGAAHVVCVNDYLDRRLRLAFPGVAAKASVIPNGIQMPVRPPQGGARPYLRRSTSWPEADPVAVFIGTVREKKGVKSLLEAVHAAREKANLRLLIVGPRPAESEYRRCSAAWDLVEQSGTLHVTGQLPRDEALAIASEGDIVVMPSLEDGMANGLLEGIALGLAPVASDIFRDVLPGPEFGWIHPKGDSARLAEALIEAGRDPAARAARADTARRHVTSRHLAETEAAAYLKLFESLLPARP